MQFVSCNEYDGNSPHRKSDLQNGQLAPAETGNRHTDEHHDYLFTGYYGVKFDFLAFGIEQFKVANFLNNLLVGEITRGRHDGTGRVDVVKLSRSCLM